jgi:hypothetical protein
MEQTLFDLLKKKPFNIEIFANIKLQTNVGIYLIDHVYVGKSDKLGVRFKHHVKSALNRGHNDQLTLYIINKFKNNEKLNITQICKYVEYEDFFISEYSKYYQLFNLTHTQPEKVREAYQKRRKNLLMEGEKMIDDQISEVTNLTEMYGDATGKNKNDIQIHLFKQIVKNLFVAMCVDDKLKDAIVEDLYNIHQKAKVDADRSEMEDGNPIVRPENFLHLEKPTIVEKPVVITEQPKTKIRYTITEKDNGINFPR